MKKFVHCIAIAILSVSMTSVFAQETEAPANEGNSCETKLDVGLDIYSSYIWRGLKFGYGPAFQPKVELTSGGFTLGAWGNVNANSGHDAGENPEAFEADLYTSYTFPFGLTLGLNDYYFGGNYLGVSFNNMARTHSIEPFFEYVYDDNLTFYGALMFMEERVTDFYCQVSYDFDLFNFAIGAGDGQYTMNPVYKNGGEFSFCNLTISKEKTIKVTDSFKIPVTGAVTLNPTNERFFVYVGMSF
ncbi:MAG TPA: hypothetical protein P5243_01775 [Bacteroidales bacterium]|jgi:hypothetical protein|nr:hypothetical protein [Bacteroidales bacterium]